MRAVLLLFFILELIACFKETVNSDSDKFKDYFWKHLGSKTPYRYVAEKNDSEVVYEGCHPKKIWAIIRHGTRYPSEKFVTKFGLRLKEIQALIINKIKENEEILSPSIAKNITLWSPQMVLENERKLAHEGEDEMIELAERFQKRFPTLLNIEYSNSTFIVSSNGLLFF